MKRYYFLFIVLILSISNTFAQGCYEKTRNKGIVAFNNKEYKKAKDYFGFASKCDDKPGNNDLNERIKECDKKIAETQPKQPPKPTNKSSVTVPVTPQTTLTVTPKNFSFDASGNQDFSSNISTNASNWFISNEIDWCNITPSSSSSPLSSIHLVCQPNLNESSRSYYFYISAGDKQETIFVKQEAAEDPIELGNKFYKEKKYYEARKLYLIGDERGSAEAQYRLGKMHLDGAGVVLSRTQAMTFFKRSADRGYSRGENALGYMYETQEFPDYAEAAKWYRKSAEKGYAVAQNNLGLMYQYGLGVKKSKREAKKWFKKSAKQGFTATERKLE